jgi:glycine hydroxymethyltransferase
MDSQAGLSLGLNASMQSPAGSSTASHSDDPLSFNFLNSKSNSKSTTTTTTSHSLSWCFVPEKQPENNVVVVVKKREHEEDEDGVVDGEEQGETINFMGRTVSVKRKIEECQQSFPVKRVAVDSKAVSWGNQPLSVADPEIHRIMEKEKLRQFKGIELIASENFVCRAVMEALGSHLTNKYSEGMPGAKYYTGNQYIDQLEFLCCERALNAFDLDSNNWGVNVQPYSCTSANFAVYTGLLNPGDRIMGLDSASGGHPSHGYYTHGGKKVSAASIFFETFSYKVNPLTGYIDYDKLEEKVVDYRPKILICGGSSYPREWDYARFRKIADKCGAILMCDMAHISGLVAAKVLLLFSSSVQLNYEFCLLCDQCCSELILFEG